MLANCSPYSELFGCYFKFNPMPEKRHKSHNPAQFRIEWMKFLPYYHIKERLEHFFANRHVSDHKGHDLNNLMAARGKTTTVALFVAWA